MSKKNAKAGPIIPAEAQSGGGLNESTPRDQRKVHRGGELDKGPNRDEETGAYLPASYKTTRVMKDGKDSQEHVIIRHDR